MQYIFRLLLILFNFTHKYFCLKKFTSFAKVCELEEQKNWNSFSFSSFIIECVKNGIHGISIIMKFNMHIHDMKILQRLHNIIGLCQILLFDILRYINQKIYKTQNWYKLYFHRIWRTQTTVRWKYRFERFHRQFISSATDIYWKQLIKLLIYNALWIHFIFKKNFRSWIWVGKKFDSDLIWKSIFTLLSSKKQLV